MNYSHLTRFVSICIFCLVFGSGAFAQAPVVIGTDTTSSVSYGPIYRPDPTITATTGKFVYLYSQAELQKMGILPNMKITSLAWYKINGDSLLTANGYVGTLSLSVHCGGVADSTYPNSTFKSSYTNNFTNVATVTYTNNLPHTAGYVPVNITPFVYTGGSLEIFALWALPNASGRPSSGAFLWQYSSTGNRITTLALTTAGLPNASFTKQKNRPNLSISYVAPSNNAAVVKFISPTKPVCAGSYPVTVLVADNGLNGIDNVQVNWSVNGVLQTPVAWNTPIGVINSTGGNQATVTLGNVTFTSGSPKTIKVYTSLPNGKTDTVNVDDTVFLTLGASLNGTYTIGGTTPDYPSIGAAVSDLNNYGVCGPVVFNIRPGTYNEHAELDTVLGTSAINTITFQSSTHKASDVVMSYASTSDSNYVFQFKNAWYTTLRKITIKPLDPDNGVGVSYMGSTSYNKVDSCTLTGVVSTVDESSSALIYAESLNGSNNTFSNDSLLNGSYGINFSGGNHNTLNNVFLNNAIINSYASAAYLVNNSQMLFKNNVITSNTGNASFYGIYNLFNTNGCVVTGNKISGVNNGTGIYITVGYNDIPNQFGVVSNNVITMGGTGSRNMAIGIQDDGSYHSRFLNNSVNITNSNPASYAAVFNYNSTTYSDVIVANNIFANTGGGPSMSLLDFGYPTPLNMTNTFDYNEYYTSGTGTLIDGGPLTTTSFNNLTSWRAMYGIDMHSINYRPAFASGTDLTPNAADTAAWALNGRGLQLDINTSDVNGNPRAGKRADGVPDIGAYEFTPTALPPVATPVPATPAVNTTQVFIFGEDTVASIKWNTSGALPATISVRQYSGTTPPAPVSNPADMYFYTDIATPTGAYNYDANINYEDIWLGHVTNEIAVKMAKKNVGLSRWDIIASTVDTGKDIISYPALTDFSQYTGTRQLCNLAPQVPIITTSTIPVSLCYGNGYSMNAISYDSVYFGMKYLWQQGSSTSGPWTSATGVDTQLTYTTPSLTATTYYRFVATCSLTTQLSNSAPYAVPIAPVPQLVSVNNGLHCGGGSVLLSATGSAGTTLRWYDSSNNYLDTGSTYTTPGISTSTRYYVAAAGGTQLLHTGSPFSLTLINSNNLTSGLIFDAYSVFTLDSVAIYPVGTGTGTITINLTDDHDRVLQTKTVTVNATADPGIKTNVPLGFYITGGTGLRLELGTITGNIDGLGVESSFSSNYNFHYPIVLPGIVSINNDVQVGEPDGVSYYYFYDWSISSRCETAHEADTAVIGSAPAFIVSSAQVACNNDITTVTVTSPQSNYDTYTWTPATALYTNAAATTPYTGGNAAILYAKTTAPGNVAYTVNAANAITQCTGIANTAVFTQPVVTAATASPLIICGSGTTATSMNPGVGYAPNTIQWQSSVDNTTFTDISGATGVLYNTPTLTDTTYYRVQVKNSAGAVCAEPSVTIAVNDPQITMAKADTSVCGSGTITLEATASAGSTISWYAAASGGPALSTSSPYATPVLSATTTFYVGADMGACESTRTPVAAVVNTPPVPVITANDPVLTTAGGYKSYQWNMDGTPISGANGSSYTYTQAGGYTVTVTDSNGCSGTSAVHQGAVGVKNVQASGADVQVYPNPATNNIHIAAPVAINVLITAMDGKVVLQESNTVNIDISRLADGVYMVKVLDISGAVLKTQKLVKTSL